MSVPPKATWREWVGLALLSLPSMLATVDINVMFLALPHISADLGAGPTQQLWIADIYGFMIAGFLITMGTLGDRIGRRKVLLGGAAAFICTSLLAAYSTSTTMLIVSRALIGIAGATIMPSVLAMISDMFKDPKQMGAAMGVWGSSIMLGVIGGPIVGGLLLGAFWWGSIFLISIPIMGVLLVAGPFLLPESRNPNAGRLDLLSVGLSLAAILPTIYGIKELGRNGWGAMPVAGLALGAACAVIFVQRQRVLDSPLLDLGLFRIRALSVALLMGLSIGLLMSGMGLTVTLFMQMVKGISPFHVGLWLLIPSFAMIVGGNMSMAIARKARPGFVMAGGGVIAILGLLVITTVSSTAGIATLLIGLVMVYVGGSPMGMMTSFVVMSSAPPEKSGTAGSVSSTGGEFGVALGVALLGIVGTAVYRGNVTVPASVPAGQTGAARGSIAGAVATADHLTGAARADLLRSAREAFTSGLHVVAIIVACCFVGLALLAAIGLRDVPPMSAPQGAPAPEKAVEPVG